MDPEVLGQAVLLIALMFHVLACCWKYSVSAEVTVIEMPVGVFRRSIVVSSRSFAKGATQSPG